MNTTLGFDQKNAASFVSAEEIAAIKDEILAAKQTLVDKNGAGNDFVGWVDLPVEYDREEYVRIKAAAERIRQDSEVLIVIGIGGSYLGARAAIEFLGHNFSNIIPAEKRNGRVSLSGFSRKYSRSATGKKARQNASMQLLIKRAAR